MVSAMFARSAGRAAVAAIALAFSLTQGFAQTKDKAGKAPAQPAAPQQAANADAKAPDIWYKLCIDVPVAEQQKPGDQKPPAPQKPEDMKKVNVCLTQVDVRDNATAILIGKIAVRQVQGQDKPQMLAMLPLGSALPPGALVRVDEKEPIKLAYTTCDQAGCYAEASIENALVDSMKTGKQIAYLGIDVTGRALSIPLPLEGFAKALDGAAVPVEKYNADQQKIADVIRTRLADLRKQSEDAAKNPAAAGQAPAATAPAAPAKKDDKKK